MFTIDSTLQKEAQLIAKTILDQLGGPSFILMTGAKNFSFSYDVFKTSLHFSLPSNFAKNGINKVSIHLMPSDTYTLEFYRLSRLKLMLIATCHDVYNDQLRSFFTQKTDLESARIRFI